MSDPPVVSCIIAFLNAQAFLEEAILSVLAQTFPDWELLLVDDGSTDGSTCLALEYTHQSPKKIRYLQHENHQNLGVSASRNLGVQAAQSKYVAFLDADDVWLPEKLEKQVNALEQNPEAALVFGPTVYWYDWAGDMNDRQLDCSRQIGIPLDTILSPPQAVELLLLNRIKAPNPSSILVKRDLYIQLGGFPEDLKIYEDQALFLKICLVYPVLAMSDCLDLYRQHENSCCSRAEKRGLYYPGHLNSAHFLFLTWIEKYFESKNIKNSKLLAALHKAYWPYRHPLFYYLINPVRFLRLIGRRILPVRVQEILWNYLMSSKE